MDSGSNRARRGSGGLPSTEKNGRVEVTTTKRSKITRTQCRLHLQVESFSSCTNHLPKRPTARVAAAAAAQSPSAELFKQVQSRPSCGFTFSARPGCAVPPCPPPPRTTSFLLAQSSAASNSGAATSSRAARRVRWACAGPSCPGGSQAPRGEQRGARRGRLRCSQGGGLEQRRSESAQRSQGAGPQSPGRAARCLPGAVRSERRRTRGRRRAGPSSHTPGPGCH